LNVTFQISRILQNGRYLLFHKIPEILKVHHVPQGTLFLGLLRFLGPARGNKSRKTLKRVSFPFTELGT
jgi:hypothetical protein